MIKLGVGIHCHVTGAFPIIRQPPGDRRWPRWCPSFFGPRPSANCRIPITTSRPPPPLLGCWENHLRSAEVGGSCQLHDVRPMRSEKLTSKQQTDTRTHKQVFIKLYIYMFMQTQCHDMSWCWVQKVAPAISNLISWLRRPLWAIGWCAPSWFSYWSWGTGLGEPGTRPCSTIFLHLSKVLRGFISCKPD